MGDVQAKARFRIMMLIAELRELAEASTTDAGEHARVEALLLHTIDALAVLGASKAAAASAGEKVETPRRASPKKRVMHISSPGRA